MSLPADLHCLGRGGKNEVVVGPETMEFGITAST